MRPFALLPPLALLATSALAQSSGSTCPFNYPADLNSTESRNGLVFTLASTNPATNNRALQLRPNPDLAGGLFVGVDAGSPVLLGNLAAAALKSQARDELNQLYDLGPTGYLDRRDETDGTSRYTVGFADAGPGGWPPDGVEARWRLLGGGEDGTYDLFHEEPVGVVNGFVLCEADHDLGPGPWFQLFYYTYEQTPAEFPGCEFVGVRTTVAATIFNGECDIGGVVAS